MNSKLSNFKYFFGDQIKESVLEQEKINNSEIRQLFKFGNISLGYVERVIQERGCIVIKFPRKMSPRLNVQRSITIISKNAREKLGSKPTEWTCTWGDFCNDTDLHSGESPIVPNEYIYGNDSSYCYVACTGLKNRLYNLFCQATSAGKSLPIIVYDPFPPVEYYRNLIHYMDMFPEAETLMLEPKIHYEDWKPTELSFDKTNPDGIAQTISDTLDKEQRCIVQGPPGSGKSYTIATIISWYLKNKKSVCVTTMANKGLIELVQQKPLHSFVEEGYVSKTNLSTDESLLVTGLRDSTNDIKSIKGYLVCATNYVLSGVYSAKQTDDYELPHFDLLVIEEASQAFLTTISAFMSLGTNCLIVGDPMQLPPIAKTSNPLYKTWNVHTQIDGLTTLALGSNIKSYKIATTFRLTASSAALTSIFYGNNFKSVKEKYLDFSKASDKYFPATGGVLFQSTSDCRNGYFSEYAYAIIKHVLDNFLNFYPNRRIAIICPFRETVTELQRRFISSGDQINLTIETIDRIQGMTVDYSILYIPARNPSFALEEKRFNVATSRSLSTTLIISDLQLDELNNFSSSSESVMKFISRCKLIH